MQNDTMQSISEINSKIFCALFALLLIFTSDYCREAASLCNNSNISQSMKTPTVVSFILDQYGNTINLHYFATNRRIWLSSVRFKHKEYTIARLEKNANP